MVQRILSGIVLSISMLCSYGAEFHVSPNGTSLSKGTIDDPWSLGAALRSSNVNPGDTIWLHGGEYGGTFISRLSGRPEAPIWVRSRPQERATINGTLEIYGADTTYWGFEVVNTNPIRIEKQWSRATGIKVYGPRTRLVNLIIHDAGQGIAWWDEAIDSEIHGCIIYNNGNSHFDHGIYAQNREGTKHLTDNIIFNNFGYGLHVYGSSDASLKGFSIRGNTLFNNGSISASSDSYQNIIVGGGSPAERIELLSNFTYSGRRNGTVSLGSPSPNLVNRHLDAYFNYMADFVLVRFWNEASVVGNTVIAPTTLLNLQVNPSLVQSAYLWDQNSYFSEEKDWMPFGFGYREDLEGLRFQNWRSATGFDRESSYARGKPTKSRVFFRQNRFEPGRVNITVYNWSHNSKVPVDLKPFLSKGARYEIRNVQDFFGEPVIKGEFADQVIDLPMTDQRVARPIGLPAPVSTSPEFNVFILLPLPSKAT